ncbi:MAG: hypothetical protein AB7U38_11460 [Hyphomicrobiales bacterium]
MSFALEYRRKRIAREAEGARKVRRKDEEGYAAPAPRRKADTRKNRLHVLAILAIAACVMAVFNSGSLVGRTQSLYETSLGREVIVASEKWHGLMEAGRLTVVVEGIRGAVSGFRDATWQDVAEYFTPDAGEEQSLSRPPVQSQAQVPAMEAATAPSPEEAARMLRGSVAPDDGEKPGAVREGPLKSVRAERAGY